MRLDAVLPAYDIADVHSTFVRATPERVFQAIKQVTPAEVPLFRVLMSIRGAPARVLTGRQSSFDRLTPLLDQFLARGFLLLTEEADRELVVGRIAQFWRLVGGRSVPLRSGGDFVNFEEPGYAKAALNFWVGREGEGTRLRTETRVRATDAASRTKFSRYWLAIGGGSALIRRDWLHAIRRAAEQAKTAQHGLAGPLG